ncbi:hypothetical protein BH23CHL2_BH23CHL2_11060 [soil metagenome]
MREQTSELDRLGVAVFAVTFESQSRIEAYQRDDPLPFPVLRDPGRRGYRLFGLGRRPATTIWGPATLWYYGRRLLQGELPGQAGESDQYQLGGDVVLRGDRAGGWVYRSSNPADRPSVGSILSLVERASLVSDAP